EPVRVAGGWFPCKLAVSAGRLKVSVGGKSIYDEELPADADPWLAVYCQRDTMGEVRHLQITGSPQVPEQLTLSTAGNLHGWVASYYREATGTSGSNADWLQSGEEVIGNREQALAGTGKESLLQYHRPLAEDGELSYRFRYEPGKMHVHPA